MFSSLARYLRRTAAWRFSALTTIAFAVGTGVAFLVAYLVVAQAIRDRSDAWLIGEGNLLAEVASQTPPGGQYATLIEEVAELASHEVLPAPDAPEDRPPAVFFLILSSGTGVVEAWVGPGDRESFLAAVQRSPRAAGEAFLIDISGWNHPFRVAAHPGSDGRMVFLGFIDEYAEAMLERLGRTFGWLWAGTLVFGFVVSGLSARRILRRVEQVTETAARVGREGLHQRVLGASGEDEIARLAGTFNTMLDRIEKSVEQIRSVTDAVAHDLRSPATAIRGDLELALTDGTPDGLRDSAASALEGLDRLLRIVQTTLDVAEADAGALRLNRQPVDLRAMAVEMVDVYAATAEERGLVFETSVPGPVVSRIDPDLVRRALANLLDNAIEHLPAGSHVTVSAASRDGKAILEVADDGPGFPLEVRAHAFERFVRGRDSRGYGLGLSLVRATARAHGGEARIEDRPGGGSVVSLAFPLAGSAN